MTYPKQLFRSPGPYGIGKRTWSVVGVADEDEEAAFIARGWFDTMEAALGEKPAKKVPAEKAEAFDHDGDGSVGGSTAPEQTDDLKALRAEYAEKMGKKAFPGWDADELLRRMDA